MREERWFIAFRFERKEFLSDQTRHLGYNSVITDVTPAHWAMHKRANTGIEYHILYAEQVSLAMASEILHCGIGIKADYFKDEEDDLC